jgi:hypothetical protein
LADILLSNDDLTVFGGPETVNLDLDFGPQGDRGSIIVGSRGNPQDASVHAEILNIPEGIQALDIAIDYSPSSSTYKTVFQRIAGPTGTQWTPLLSLKTNFYSEVKGPLTPVSGKITIPPINIKHVAFNRLCKFNNWINQVRSGTSINAFQKSLINLLKKYHLELI